MIIMMIQVYIKLVVCAGLINIFLSLHLEMQDVNYVSNFIDIDIHILKHDTSNMSKDFFIKV